MISIELKLNFKVIMVKLHTFFFIFFDNLSGKQLVS